MFHEAVNLKFLEGTSLEMTFQDGKVRRYDMSALYEKYPQLLALNDRSLFTSGKLMGMYGIFWNDDLDIEAETIYEEEVTVSVDKGAENVKTGEAAMAARAQRGITQKALTEATGIDQADISNIEREIANPTVGTLQSIAEALNLQLSISFVQN